ncbi:MAG: Signal peptidase I T [Pelotomaculum sp. PtaB.Bin104]|nr:MAG: Signal peptidase I T [Pelotomaculum sp. PtaB.Bin104]
MKKFIFSLVLLICLSFLCLIDTAQASPRILFNGRTLNFSVPPVIENDRILVPLRAVFEALGADVQWDSSIQTVTATKDDTEIKLIIGGQAYKNSQPINIDVPAKIINDSTFVPLRFVSEAMGCTVNWDEESQIVTISSTPDTNESFNVDAMLNSSLPSSGYISVQYNRIKYLSWVNSGSGISGQLIIIQVDGGETTGAKILFEGTINGSEIEIAFSDRSLPFDIMTGTISGNALNINYITKDGTFMNNEFYHGTLDDFKKDIESVKVAWQDLFLFRVPGESMKPAIPAGSYIMVKRISDFNTIQRGDIITFKYPLDPSRFFVKRVIAFGGETISMKNSQLLINGSVIPETYLADNTRFYDYGPVTIPEENYFVLGDNRSNSDDSRVWGFLPQEMIIGKVIISGDGKKPQN